MRFLLRAFALFSFFALITSAVTVRKFEVGPQLDFMDGLGTVSLSLDGCGVTTDPLFNKIVKYCPSSNTSVEYPLPSDELYPSSAFQDLNGRFHFTSVLSDSIFIYDPSDNSLQQKSFDYESFPQFTTVSPNGNVYVTLFGVNKLAVYPLNTQNLTDDVQVVDLAHSGPEHLLYNIFNGRVCVSMARSGKIVCYDNNWNELVIPISGYSVGLTVSTNGSLCFSYNNGADGYVGCVSAFCQTATCVANTRTDVSFGYNNRVHTLISVPASKQLLVLMRINNALLRVRGDGSWEQLNIFDPLPYPGLMGPQSISYAWVRNKLGYLISTFSSKILYTLTL